MNNEILRVAIVDNLSPKTNYSRFLYSGFQKINSQKFKISFYTSKYEKAKDLPNIRKIWSQNLYPFQIFQETLKDRPEVLHLQFEFTTFGSSYGFLLVPLLLFLLRVIRVKTIVTIHAIIPKESIDRNLVETLTSSSRMLPLIFVKLMLILFYRAICLLSSATIVHGNCFRSYLLSSYGVAERKVHVIPHGVETEVRPGHMGRALLSRLEDVAKDKEVILSFGSLSPRKGLEFLIRAYSCVTEKHPKYVLVIAGKERPTYNKYVRTMKRVAHEVASNKILFTGEVDDEEIHALYELANFVVLPYIYSISASGPLCFAMQHLRPVIVTETGFFGEEITDQENGLLVLPGHIPSLAKAMETLIDDEELRTRISRNLKLKAINISWARVAQQTYELYLKI